MKNIKVIIKTTMMITIMMTMMMMTTQKMGLASEASGMASRRAFSAGDGRRGEHPGICRRWEKQSSIARILSSFTVRHSSDLDLHTQTNALKEIQPISQEFTK